MKTFSFSFYNIRSLVPHFTEFKTFLLEKKFDIVGLSETWLNSGIPTSRVNIDGYKFIRSDRDTRGGGIGIYVSNYLETEIVYRNCSFLLEEVWIKIKLKNINIILGTIYRPPTSNVADFLDSFENSLSQLYTNCHDIICGGDINIDLLNIDEPKTLSFMKTIELFNLKQVISSATRISGTSSTLIDIILVPADKISYNNFGTDNLNNLSDHSLVFGKSNFTSIEKTISEKKSRCLSKIDKKNFLNFLTVVPLENIFYITDPNQKVVHFTQLIISLFDEVAPYNIIKYKQTNQPWCTAAIRYFIKQKDQAFIKFRKHKTPQNWNYYKYLKNETTNAINREKRAFLEYTINENKGNSKVVWNTLKKLDILNKKSNSVIPSNLNIPNDINNFFLQFSQLEQPDPNLILFYSSQTVRVFPEKLVFRLTEEQEVYNLLSSIRSNAIGPDGLNGEMLKLCCPYILKFLVNIYNSSILSGKFPELWKISKVFPLPKTKGDPTDFSELRPISILSPCSKIFEKILTVRLIEHINENNILPLRQSGFRKGYSCCTALLDVVDTIVSNLDSGNSCVLILLDYTKAFDKINHELLFAILHYIGLSEDAINLIRSYLSSRVQYVETDKGYSEKGSIYCGVPQGSGLSPLLFCIYTCYISHDLKHCIDFSFADDRQLLHSVMPGNIIQAQIQINEDLNRLVINSEKHHLKLNPSKTKVLAFGKQKNILENHLKITFNNAELPFVEKAKNLGIMLDTDLRFTDHISLCIQKAYANLKLLYPHRHALNQKLKLVLSDALVLSHFNYCDTLYDPCLTKRDKGRIQRVQRSCLRFVYGIRKFEPVIHKLKDAKWLDMDNRRKFHSSVLFQSIIYNKSPPYLYNKIQFRSDVHTLNLRFKGMLSPPIHNTSLFTRSFSYNVYNLFNQLPLNLKNLRPANFKYLYKKMFLPTIEG